MTRIEEALDALFTYKRNHCQLRAKLVQESYSVQGIGHLNVVVERKDPGFSGVVPFMGTIDNRSGLVMAYYTAERDLVSEGQRLPAPFDAFNDSPKVHYGLLLNCLAVLSGERVGRLSLVQMTPNVITPMMIKPDIAEFFLSKLAKIEKVEAAPPPLKGKAKRNYVAPNQVKMF